MNFKTVPTPQEARFLVFQCLRDKTTDFSVDRAHFQLTRKGAVTELWMLGDNFVPFRLLFKRANALRPLEEFPSLIVEQIGRLEKEKETMLRYGFREVLDYRAYILSLPLTDGKTGTLRLERVKKGDSRFVKAAVSWANQLEDEVFTVPDRSTNYVPLPLAAVSFMGDKFFQLVNTTRFLNRLDLYTTMTKSFQDDLLIGRAPSYAWTQEIIPPGLLSYLSESRGMDI